MAIREIRTDGDPILREKAAEVKNFGPWLKRLIGDMWDTLTLSDGVGLAAPQIGISKRIVIIDYDEQKYCLINPRIEEKNGVQNNLEACLSVPGFSGMVERAAELRVLAIDENQEPVEINADGLLAVIIQHELDHLDGILYVDLASEMFTNEELAEEQAEEIETE